MYHFSRASGLLLLLILIPLLGADQVTGNAKNLNWTQWRGPTRDGIVDGVAWPAHLSKESCRQVWRLPLGKSYSGPLVTDDLIFTTESKKKDLEAVVAVDRKSGLEVWRREWSGSLTVPFFAAANGSWIRSTPAFDGDSLYVAGIRDVLVCLNAKTGEERWRSDFVERFKTAPPTFGFVCSPLVDGDFVYVQAGASLVCLNKFTGELIWRTLKDSGGMNGSAFSSPIIATLAGKPQLVVQTREKLAGIDLQTGDVLWSQVVPAFRGMNILTPVIVGDAIFTSSYQNKSWLYQITQTDGKFQVVEAWNNNAAGYMSTPVVIAGHAYLHLQNQRLTCIDLSTGKRTWTTQPYGKYWSLVAQGDRILALDSDGSLIYFKANPQAFELIDQFKISDAPTWAHLGIRGNELLVRELEALTLYEWQATP